MQFRPASGEDLNRVQVIARDTVDMSYRSFIDDDRVDWFISGPSDEYLCKNNDDVTLILVDGSIVGLAVCKQDLIDLIIIDHESHGHGFGTALLAHCEAEMFERYDVIRLEASKQTPRRTASVAGADGGECVFGRMPCPVAGRGYSRK
jgi:ribosomal protein S18 acetylase RimI-like enzyme